MKNYVLSIWNAVDPIYFSCTRLCYVSDDENQTVFRVRLTKYKGPTVVLKDGTEIKKNDVLIKIHLHNARILNELQTINSGIRRAVYVYQSVKNALPRLANYVNCHTENGRIKGIIGITTLYGGAKRLGFEVIPIKNLFYRVFKKIAWLPITMLADGSGHKTPVYLFMSKDQLAKKYRLK